MHRIFWPVHGALHLLNLAYFLQESEHQIPVKRSDNQIQTAVHLINNHDRDRTGNNILMCPKRVLNSELSPDILNAESPKLRLCPYNIADAASFSAK